MKAFLAAVAAIGALATAGSASAAIFITSATDAGVVKVFGSGGDQLATTVTGIAGGGTVVNFTSSTLLSLDGTGYAQISGLAPDGVNGAGKPKYKSATYSDFTISLADPLLGFTAVEFNGQAHTNLYADLTATLAGGGSLSLNDVFFGNGNNDYRVYTTGGDIITSLSFAGYTTAGGTTPAGFDQFKQIDIGAVTIPVSAVPEPATWAMLIVGFAGVGTMLRRARRKGGLAAAAA